MRGSGSAVEGGKGDGSVGVVERGPSMWWGWTRGGRSPGWQAREKMRYKLKAASRIPLDPPKTPELARKQPHSPNTAPLLRDIGMKTYLHGPKLRDRTETAISCRGPGPTRKKKEIYQ